MVHWVKAFTGKTDKQEPHGGRDSQKLPSDLHVCAVIHTGTHTQNKFKNVV